MSLPNHLLSLRANGITFTWSEQRYPYFGYNQIIVIIHGRGLSVTFCVCIRHTILISLLYKLISLYLHCQLPKHLKVSPEDSLFHLLDPLRNNHLSTMLMKPRHEA